MSKLVLMKRIGADDEIGEPFDKAITVPQRPDDAEADIAALHDMLRGDPGVFDPPDPSHGPASFSLALALHLSYRERPDLSKDQHVARAISFLSHGERHNLLLEQARAKAGLGPDIGKKQGEVHMDQSGANALNLAKRTIATGVPIMSRADCTAEINKIADAIRQPGETVEKSRVRARYEDERGRLFHKAGENAGGVDHAPAAILAPRAEAPTGAAAEMQAAADACRKANPKLSEAQAFTAVYTARENAELKKRFDIEDALAKRAQLAAAGAGGGAWL